MKTLQVLVLLVAYSAYAYAQNHDAYTVTVSNGGVYSSEVTSPSKGCTPGSVITNDWTGSTVTFQVKIGSTWYDLYDSYGTLVTATVGSNRATLLDLPNLYTFKTFRVRSGTPSVPVTQTAERTVVLTCK